MNHMNWTHGILRPTESVMSYHPNLGPAVRTVERYIDGGMETADAISEAAFEHGLSRNLVYREYIEYVES